VLTPAYGGPATRLNRHTAIAEGDNSVRLRPTRFVGDHHTVITLIMQLSKIGHTFLGGCGNQGASRFVG